MAHLHHGILLINILAALGVPAADPQPSYSETVALCRASVFGDQKEILRGGKEGLAIEVLVVDSCTMERQIKIIQKGDGEPRLVVVTTVGTGLYSQVGAIMEKEPGIEPEQVCKRLKLHSYSPESISAEDLERIIMNLKRLEFNPIFDSPLIMGGSRYEIWISYPFGKSYFSFFGIPGEIENPLSQWVDNILSAAEIVCENNTS